MERTDPIDQLVPRPRPLPVRLVLGLLIVGLVGVVSVVIGFGYVYPQPECCGSGGGAPFLVLDGDGESVVLVTSIFNSSGRSLRIEGATAALPGARVLEVRFATDPERARLWPVATSGFPTTFAGTTSIQIVIRFVPERCDERPDARIDARWGSATLRLSVADGWLPSIDREWVVPGGLVDVGRGDLGVLTSGRHSTALTPHDPLRAACDLLAGG